MNRGDIILANLQNGHEQNEEPYQNYQNATIFHRNQLPARHILFFKIFEEKDMTSQSDLIHKQSKN